MIEKIDSELVSEAKNGNHSALETLVARHLPKARQIIFNIIPDLEPQDFNDATQLTLIRVWKNIKDFRGDSSFYTWFFKILKNQVLTFVAKTKIQKFEISIERLNEEKNQESEAQDFCPTNAIEDLFWENPENSLEKRENSAILREMLDKTMVKLTPNHMEILKLLLEEEKTYKEISESLNLGLGTVMSRIYYAKKHIQKLIRDYSNRHSIELPLTKSNI